MMSYNWENDLIALRPLMPEDWEALAATHYESESRFFITFAAPWPTDDAAIRRLFKRRSKDTDSKYFTILDRAGAVVGLLSCSDIDMQGGYFGPMAIEIVPEQRRKGYAKAALLMFAAYMFGEQRMHKWNSTYVEGNEASAALHESLGFTIEGVGRDEFFHQGRYWNQVLCGMTEDEFFARWPQVNTR